MTLSHTLVVDDSPDSRLRTIRSSEVYGLEGRFTELVVETELQELENAWSLLRALHQHCEDGAVLTVHGSAGAADALTRLGGYEPFHCEQLGAGVRVRARAIDRHARPLRCSVIVPCRNEAANIQPLVERLPAFPGETELLFVDGASTDGTPDRIGQAITEHPEKSIRLLRQRGGLGKADAVFEGFDAATGDVLIILDADMTVAPEDLPRFYLALAEGVARFASGTRFVYGMETGAMHAANRIGNMLFSRGMTWLVGHRLSDTLCGTKALFRSDWERLRDVRPLFGQHDRWGDFDLLLGATYLGLPIVEVPISYHARVAGESKMHAFHDAPGLLRTLGRGALTVKLGVGHASHPRP